MDSEKLKSPLGVASFVLGIISVVSAFFYYISLPCGVLAIVYGVKAKKRYCSKLGTAGFILGIIGLSLLVFIYALFISGIALSNMY